MVLAPKLPQRGAPSPIALLRIQKSKVPPERFIREVIPRRRRAAMDALKREEERKGREVEATGAAGEPS